MLSLDSETGYFVQVSMYRLPMPGPPPPSDECAQDQDQGLGAVPQPAVPRPYFHPEFIEFAKKRTQHERKKSGESGAHEHLLIADGGVPSWGVPISRLEQGVYWLGLRLMRTQPGVEDGEGEAVIAAEGGSVLRITPGRNECLRRSKSIAAPYSYSQSSQFGLGGLE